MSSIRSILPSLLGVTAIVFCQFLGPTPANALTCSEQAAKCVRACNKADKQGTGRSGGGRCDASRLCGELFKACMTFGCWEGPQFKACGLMKR